MVREWTVYDLKVLKMSDNWESLVKGLEVKDPSKPRLSNKRLMLTYKNHLNKEEVIQHITALALKYVKREPVCIEVAHETGRSNGIDYPHTHVVVDFGDLFNSKAKGCLRFFDFEDDDGNMIHPNIRIIKSDNHWKNAMRYLSKEDPDNAHLANFGKGADIDIDGVMNASSDIEAIKTGATKWSDVTGILATRRCKGGVITPSCRRPAIVVNRDEHEWWQLIFDLHESEMDPRAIHWIYDRKGGKGKSRLCRYMLQEYGEDWLVMDVTTKVSDAAEYIDSAIRGGWQCHGVLIDVPRQCNDWKGMYTVIEKIKNGQLSSGKYSTKSIVLPRYPHVVILSNSVPHVRQVTKARWRIFELEGDQARRMTLKEVNEAFRRDQLKAIKHEAKEFGLEEENVDYGSSSDSE